MKIEKSIIINTSKGRVWDVLSDFKDYPVWLRSNEKVEVTSRESTGEGVTYRVSGELEGRRYRTENKVIEWREDEKLVVITTSIYGISYSTYKLNKVPAGCEVIYTVEILLTKKFQERGKISAVQLQDQIYKSSKSSVEEILYSLKDYLEKA